MKFDVKISSIRPDGAIKAYASVNLNQEIAITGIKIMEGSKGTFVAMPSYKTAKGEYKDICFPITKEAREQLNKAVLNAYEQALSQVQGHSHRQEVAPSHEQELSGM